MSNFIYYLFFLFDYLLRLISVDLYARRYVSALISRYVQSS